ncbi:hypothetical protein [Clostridium tetani]|uniref:Uncharacterized protein n=1 Tax=Clostridium tetani TaxID=1513 RepID=A0ABY0ES27_CLOTA|nr:hypothetical protein [Clostridium tetani]CDI49076.1 hypothetical protein BN906_01068 [Clostridium tetani 12124569]KHO39626.1 hypothetical protein OR62_05050 [Clostridium tetani]RXI38625.1 hypothetical protein DP129_10370 [Clostridium tetani]RXI55431.1 hypothetical protein DP131_08515 [Clostridium tetani]RXI68502.1 hypothetical protein DQN76_09555 [Clostridium tetani]
MKRQFILQFLLDDGLTSISQIRTDDMDTLNIKFRYEFNDYEIEASESYARDMLGELKDIAKEDLKSQFLKEIAMDEVDQILDELKEEVDIKSLICKIEKECIMDRNYIEFIVEIKL